ncbi:hypothetical protein OKA05_27285 [Luteolibacter arcticus]|uniref:Uncharacterized protein n=1 Tax=Luteolibacter arcticus TaxID=1581411 RepID=A0ABT3GS07_9BACT|nr:hypothetical protein [Luteolibacter arcticus]MCW1926288.1 hypothetical protein [Luteolibacter arcticus]
MSAEEPFEVEVEVVFVLNDGRSLRHVVVRPLQPIPNFTITDRTTLDGLPITAIEMPPRALHPDGSPRMDLLNFRLRNRPDCSRFQPGQRALLKGIQLHPWDKPPSSAHDP